MDTKNSDIIIIGGGVIGLASAWRLAKEGHTVRLFEKNICGCGASNASMGVLNPPTPLSHNPLQIIHRKSLRVFPDFAKELISASSIDFHYIRCGALEIIPSETQVQRAKKEVAFTEENISTIPNLPQLQLLTPQEVLELEPKVNVLEFGALYTPSSAKVDVDPFISALKQACLNTNKVEIIEQCKVNEVLISNYCVTGIKTESQDIYSAPIVLATVGVWTNELGAPLTQYTKVTPVRGQAVLTKYPNLQHIIKWQKGYLVPYPDDCVALGGTTEKKAGYDEICNIEGVSSIIDRAKTVFPEISKATFLGTWAGLRPAPDDRRPYIGELPNYKGLFVCTGHYKIGFSLTPITSELVTKAILKQVTDEELAPFLPRESAT